MTGDGLRVIDAHVHFWDPVALRYPWLAGEPDLARPFGPADYPPLAAGEVYAVVFVEANVVPGQAVGAAGKPFDLCITADQLRETIELVERCPDVHFVLDHCGKPAIRDDAFADWARDLERIASHQRVSCKISGLLTEAREDQRTAEAFARWIEHARECFGASRLLYGSDWPVSTLGGGARRWRSIVDAITAAWPEGARRAFFADTASRVYGLSVTVHG